MIFSETPRSFRLLMVSTMSGLGGSKEDEKPRERHAGFIGLCAMTRSGAHVLVRNAQRPETLAAEFLKMLLDPFLHRGDLDDALLLRFPPMEQTASTFGRAPFGHHQMRVPVRHQDAQPLPQKIIRDFVLLLIAGQIKLAMRADGLIDRVRKARFIEGIEICVEKDLLAWGAFHIQGGVQAARSLPSGCRFYRSRSRSCCRSFRSRQAV